MHDRNGKPLSVGDKVVLEGTITQTFPGSDTCNLVIASEPTEKFPQGRTYTLEAAQVAKVE